MKEIAFVQFHEGGMMVPEVLPNLTNVLPNPQKRLDIKMFDAGDKLLLRVTSKSGKTRDCFVPMTAVKIALYAQVEVKSETKAES